MLRSFLFWSCLPWVVPQALKVRKTAPRFADARGPRQGSIGEGPVRTLLAIGDSIIAGVGASDLCKALVGGVAERLSTHTNTKIQWQAFGQTGANCRTVIEELVPNLPQHPADYVVVSVGVNDVTSLTSLTRWKRDLATLLVALGQHSPNATIGLAGLPPLGSFPLLPQPLRALMGLRGGSLDAAAKTIASRFDQVVHVPIGFDTEPEKFAGDGYHPSEVGYADYANQMTSYLLGRSIHGQAADA